MTHKKFSITDRLKSFKYAFNGLRILFKEEHNARIHAFITFMVLFAAYLLKISALEWIALLFAIGLVISQEIINTAIEHIANFILPGKDHQIKIIKDLSAAAVLITAIIAVIIGFIIFIPKLLQLC
jgi:diacylglycerol kinase